MAQCTQLIQTSATQSLNPPPASPSPTPVIWAPLVQAPLQAAAATTPLALALAHHSQLPPILFHHPLAQGSGSLKDPIGHTRRVHVGAHTSSFCGSSPSSPVNATKLSFGVETPMLASLRPQHLSTGPLTPTVSQPIFTSSLQPLVPLPQPPSHPPYSGSSSVFPVSQATVSYTCAAQLHPQRFHGAMTTPPLPMSLLHQGETGRLAGRFPAPSSSAVSPLIASSISSILGHLQQTPHTVAQQMGSGHDSAGRISSGLNLSHLPFITSTQSSGGFIHPVSGGGAGAAASLAQHSLAGLHSVFLPQVLPEHSALASLAQYGSAETSPCYTPPVHSPSIRSPARGRTIYPSELPSTITPQTSCPTRVTCKESGGSPTELLTQEIKTISGSHCSTHQERPLTIRGSSEGVAGVLSSPFPSPLAVSKPYSPIPGQATPVSWTHSGPVHSHHPGSPAKTLETELKQSKLPSNL